MIDNLIDNIYKFKQIVAQIQQKLIIVIYKKKKTANQYKTSEKS